MKFKPQQDSLKLYDIQKIKSLRLAIIRSEFNGELTEKMTLEARQAFCDCGASEDQIDVFHVPGSFEIPLAAKKAAQTKKYDAILCFGVVIKGETYHFESVADAAVMGISQVALETEIPLIHGILTTYTLEQALERTALGKEYLYAALRSLETLHQIENQKAAVST